MTPEEPEAPAVAVAVAEPAEPPPAEPPMAEAAAAHAMAADAAAGHAAEAAISVAALTEAAAAATIARYEEGLSECRTAITQLGTRLDAEGETSRQELAGARAALEEALSLIRERLEAPPAPNLTSPPPSPAGPASPEGGPNPAPAEPAPTVERRRAHRWI